MTEKLNRRLISLDSHYKIDPFGMFKTEQVVHNFDEMKNGDVLILWGGEDIHPSYYGQRPNSRMFVGPNPSMRDTREFAWAKEAVRRGVPIIGICRGAQLLCVLTGGKLMQHIDGHQGPHEVTLHDEGDKVISCNSSHHQMMMPTESQVVLASSVGTTCVEEFNVFSHVDRVNEVVWFPGIDALGIQPHPEWASCPLPFVNYCKRKITELICHE